MKMEYTLSELIDIILMRSDLMESQILQDSGYKDLTPNQLECLDIIRQLNNPSLSEIAAKLAITRPSVTVMIDKLIKRDYVIRVKSDKDRRSAHIHLTEKGQKVTALHSSVHNKIASLVSSGLNPDETRELVKILNKSIQYIK